MRAPGRRRRVVPVAGWSAAAVLVLALVAVLVNAVSPGWLPDARAGASRSGRAAGSRPAPGPVVPATSSPSPGSSSPSASPGPGSTGTPTPAVAVPESASGTLRAVDVPGGAPAAVPGRRTVTYAVEVEDGLDVDRTAFAAFVRSVLDDPRGWQPLDSVRLVPVPASAAAGADLQVSLASPHLVDRLCAPLQTEGAVSCHNGQHVMINYRRWVLGVPAYGSDLTGYRTYLVNHEVGHGLGHGHLTCPGAGRPAPVMMQQTKGVGACRPWPWPAVPAG